MEKVKCPKCTSNRVVITHYAPGADRSQPRVCGTCKGTQLIDADVAQRIADGEVWRDARIEARLSLRELAKMADVSPSELSDFENGHLGVAAYNAVELKIRLTPFGQSHGL